MKSPGRTASENPVVSRAGNGLLQGVPKQLRRHGRLANGLLIIVWFFASLTVFFSVADGAHAVAALLPALAIAAHLSATLTRALGKNHRAGEEKSIFPTLGAGNWFTVLRAAMVVVLACLFPLTLPGSPLSPHFLGWLGGGIYLLIGLTDLLDGYAARRQNRESELGKILDMETDAAGLLAGSLLAILLGRLPALYLLVALAYYLFVGGIWWRKRQGLPMVTLQYRPYGRIIAGCQMGLIALGLFPVFSPVYTHLGALLFMLPFLVGFTRDWLVVSCRIETDANQRCRLDSLWAASVRHTVAILARVLVVLSWYFLYRNGYLAAAPLFWLFGYTISGVLILAGVLGRAAALVMLLLLGLGISPAGTAVAAMVGFLSATTLFLLGNGPFSLWSPEEDLLYRRRKTPGEPTEAG